MTDASARYGVEVELKKVGDGWDDLSAGVGKFTGMLDAAAGKVARLGMMTGAALGAGAFAAMTWGVTKLNAEAEGAAISIGTIFSVNGLAANVPAGITMAQEQIAKMRVDAQKLPGEFEDLQNIFMTTAIPQFQAGATADQARQLSAQIMAAGAVMGLQSDMTARESAMLLSGRAGAHNVFGTRLGFSGEKAKELNKASPEERLKMVSAETNKYAGSIDIFAHSYEGLSSTLVDNAKNFARLATAPLFEDVKDTLGDINDWFTHNQGQINRFATRLGGGIRDAFDWGKKEIEEWYPIIADFVDVAMHRLGAFWDDVKPSVMAFGEAFKDALRDPNGTIDKLSDLLKLYAAVKIGGGVLGFAGAGSQMMKGAGNAVLGLAGAAGGGAEVAGGAAAGGAAMEVGGLGAAAAGAAAPLAAFAAVTWAAYEAFGLYEDVKHEERLNQNAIAEARAREITEMIEHGASRAEVEARVNSIHEAMAQTVGKTNDAMNHWGGTLGTYNDQLQNESNKAQQHLNDLAVSAALASSWLAVLRPPTAAEKLAQLNDIYGGGPGGDSDAEKKRLIPKVSGHGMSIQKVEIVVTSNQSPSRIARAIHGELAQLSQNRRASPFVRNFSARDE